MIFNRHVKNIVSAIVSYAVYFVLLFLIMFHLTFNVFYCLKVHQETFGKSGCRRIVPGQYLAIEPKGRAVMIGKKYYFKNYAPV